MIDDHLEFFIMCLVIPISMMIFSQTKVKNYIWLSGAGTFLGIGVIILGDVFLHQYQKYVFILCYGIWLSFICIAIIMDIKDIIKFLKRSN